MSEQPDLLRLETDSITEFIHRRADDGVFQSRRVLDYGCGRQPYRRIIELGGGDYRGYDRASFGANMSHRDIGDAGDLENNDVVVSTQVIQFVTEPLTWLKQMIAYNPGMTLVLTGPTNWPVVNHEDLWRWTLNGIEMLVQQAGFHLICSQYRAHASFNNYNWHLGWGLVAHA